VKVEDNPELPVPLSVEAWESILEKNPSLERALNRLALRQALQTAVVLVPLTSGLWAALNGAIQLLGLGGEAWLISGLALTVFGAIFTWMRLQ